MASQSASPSNPWLYAGPASSYPNITPSTSTGRLSDSIANPSDTNIPLCKILQLPSTDSSSSSTTEPTLLTPTSATSTVGLTSQILIFRYRDTLHAVDHQCPHRSYPLSRGTLNDIEDFGVVLSAEIVCPKHGWGFDVFTGESDRGSYRLGVWDVEVRRGGEGGREGDEEVWVRKMKKERIG